MSTSKAESESIWALILLASPVLSLYLWSFGLGDLSLKIAAGLVVYGLLVGFTKWPRRWRNDASLIVLAGLVQFVLVLPLAGFLG